MKTNVGNIVSKTSGRKYNVIWDDAEQTSWINKGQLSNQIPNAMEMVCSNVKSAKAAIICAQDYIASQSESY